MTAGSHASALDYELDRAPDADDGSTVAVLLHGRGSNRRDLQGLRPMLPGDWTLLTPEAPFPGAAWGYGPGSAWYRYLGGDEVVAETLEESFAKLERFLGELPEVIGFEPGKVVLGGFSQGGTLSLAYALAHVGAVTAVLNFSGFLIATVELDESGASPPEMPIFWGHGVDDPALPITLAEKGRERLRSAGAKLTARDYRIGHWIVPDEVQEAVAFVQALD
jgi:phospholipase/carboxylesterase